MSDVNKLTNEEAESLLKMLKKSLTAEINFPSKGESVEFEVIGDNKKRFVCNPNLQRKDQ